MTGASGNLDPFPVAAQVAIPFSTRHNFQVRFVLDAIFYEFKDKSYVSRRHIIKLGDNLLEEGVLTIKRRWEDLKKEIRLTILSEIFNVPYNLEETFATRDICMKWVYDISPTDHELFLQKETEFVLERLCDERTAYLVSEKWCIENNFQTHDSSDVWDNICKVLGKSDKDAVTKNINDELVQRETEFNKFQQTEWISAAIDNPEAITWNPLLFYVCATKFDIVIPVISNMALPTTKGAPVVCECRIYPRTHNRTTLTRTSATTLIRKTFHTFVGAAQGEDILPASVRIDIVLGMLAASENRKTEKSFKGSILMPNMPQAGYMKSISENKELHEKSEQQTIGKHPKNIEVERMKAISENKELHEKSEQQTIGKHPKNIEVERMKAISENKELHEKLKKQTMGTHLNKIKEEHMKVISENKELHEKLKEAIIKNKKLVEEKKDLLRQLKSKPQKDFDKVVALEEEIKNLKRQNNKLETELEQSKKKVKIQDQKIENLNNRIDEIERKIPEKKSYIVQ